MLLSQHATVLTFLMHYKKGDCYVFALFVAFFSSTVILEQNAHFHYRGTIDQYFNNFFVNSGINQRNNLKILILEK